MISFKKWGLIAGLLIVLEGCQMALLINTKSADWGFQVIINPMDMISTNMATEQNRTPEVFYATFETGPDASSTPIVGFFSQGTATPVGPTATAAGFN